MKMIMGIGSIITIISTIIIFSIIIIGFMMGAKGVEQLPLIASIGFKPPAEAFSALPPYLFGSQPPDSSDIANAYLEEAIDPPADGVEAPAPRVPQGPGLKAEVICSRMIEPN